MTRLFLIYTPILLHGAYALLNSFYFREKLHTYFPNGFSYFDEDLIASTEFNLITPLVPIQAILFPLPFLAILYIIDWIPFFLKKHKRPLHDMITGIHVVYSDKRKPSIVRTIIKVPLIILSILFLLPFAAIISWTAYNIPDRPLNPEVEEFFYENDFKPEDNVRTIWAGLYAPAGTKDVYEYGLKVYNGEIEGTQHIKFKGEVTRDYLPDNDGQRTIPSADEINTVYNDNKELIERYIRFYDYRNYDAPNTTGGYIYGQDIITLHKFLPPYWEQMTRNGSGEDAIKWWLKDMGFIQNMMGTNSGLVEKAI